MFDGISLGGIGKALVAVVGGLVYGFLGGVLPSFNYSGIVYAVVGLLIVCVGFHLVTRTGGWGWGGAFLVGFGLVMASGLVSAVKGLLPTQAPGG